jgi:hypothetical protein
MAMDADSEDTNAGFVPAALRGLWDREEIFTPSGYRDTTTRVVWLQTRRFYGDLRIPADRPSRPGARDFGDFGDDDLIALARVQGFGGVLTASPDVCLWRRDLDYQPPGETPDEARYEIEGDRMAELGIHAEYTEIWRRAPESAEPHVALRRETGAGGLLVIAGDHFLEIQGRDVALPAGETLAAIVERDLAEGRRDLARARLLMRICHGRIAGGAIPWEITRSSFPWLEGESLFAGETPRFDAEAGVLHRGEDQLWRVEDSTAPLATVARLLAGAPTPAPP